MATSLTFVSKEIQKYVIFEGCNYDLNQIIVEIVLGKLDKLGQKWAVKARTVFIWLERV